MKWLKSNLAVIMVVAGILVWGVKLEAQSNHNTNELPKIESRSGARDDEILRRLERIEDKLDRSLGISKIKD